MMIPHVRHTLLQLCALAYLWGCRAPESSTDDALSVVEFQRDLVVHESVKDIASIADLEVGHGGEIYVLNADDQSVSILDSAGTHIASFGRKGEGPGEFRGAGKLAIRRDSLWVVDHGSRRATQHDLDGANARVFHVQPNVVGVSTPVAPTATGMLVVVNVAYGATGNSANAGGATSLLLHTNRTGDVLDTLAALREPSATLMYAVVSAEPGATRTIGLANAKQPFVSRSYWSLNADGSSLIIATDDPRADQLPQTELTISTVSLSGDTIDSHRVLMAREPVSKADVDAVVDSLSQVFTLKGGIRVRADDQMLRDSLNVPRYWPLISALTVGRDGSIWLRRTRSAGSDTLRYWVLPPGEQELQGVSLPSRFKLMRASKTTLWGWSRDDDGLPMIERFKATNPH